MTNRDVLLVTADPARRAQLSHLLESSAYSAAEVDSISASEKWMRGGGHAAVAVVDYSLDTNEQFLLSKLLKQRAPETQIILLSSSSNVIAQFRAENEGVFWTLTNPYENEELLYVVARGVVMHQLALENVSLKEALKKGPTDVSLVTASASMQNLLRRVHRIASLQATVLLTGESGTGKTLLASLIHKSSDRSSAPFVALSCANFPKDLLESELFGHEKGAFTGASSARAGMIELANGGTLFLDEIGELPLDLQPKLLTFLQDKKVRRVGGSSSKAVDVRIICATNRDLSECVERGGFRADLFYRVNVLSLLIPPLRERLADLPELCAQILKRLASQRSARAGWTLTMSALDMLQRHPWPGNIRELEHVLERATAFCDADTITAEDLEISYALKEAQSASPFIGHTLAEIEAMAIRSALDHCRGDKVAMAKMLGVSLKTVYNKLKELSLDANV